MRTLAKYPPFHVPFPLAMLHPIFDALVVVAFWANLMNRPHLPKMPFSLFFVVFFPSFFVGHLFVGFCFFT